jgi:acyl-coenzyme A thioesterase PaaI-like protein
MSDDIPDPAHFRALESMYHDAPCNDRLEPTLSIGPGEAIVEFEAIEATHHAAGGMHGAYYFKALDDAAFFAVNSLVEDVFVLTTGFDVHLERPVSEGVVRAAGEVVNANPRQLLATAVAEDADGNEIARGTGRFARSRTELDASVGYERP